MSRSPFRALWVTAAIGLLVAVVWRWDRLGDAYWFSMLPVRVEIWQGDMGWAGRAATRVHRVMANHSDRHVLAERFLREKDGSLVAEGMVLAVQSRHPHARELITAHLADDRWNWSMTDNRCLATQLLQYLDQRSVEHWVAEWIRETEAAR